jgi:hypothetical protein
MAQIYAMYKLIIQIESNWSLNIILVQYHVNLNQYLH